MQEQNALILILQTREFRIPSHFPFLIDVNPKIYNELISKKRYKVKSNVSNEIFQNFIDNWINGDHLNIDLFNFQQYKSLSIEFDRIKSCVQLFYESCHKLYPLYQLNQQYQNEAKKAHESLENENHIYKKIIDILKANIPNSYSNFNQNKKELLEACRLGDTTQIIFLISKKIEKNGLLYLLNNEDKTSYIVNNNISATDDLLIPKYIEDGSQKYLITTISEEAFKNCDKIRCIQFSKDSELQYINIHSFAESSLERIFIPQHVKRIGANAFFECKGLKEVTFSENCELEVICSSAFSESSIEKITIPSRVKEINEFAFEGCENLQDVTFSENSELETIDQFSFARTSINEISIPSNVNIIQNNAFSLC